MGLLLSRLEEGAPSENTMSDKQVGKESRSEDKTSIIRLIPALLTKKINQAQGREQ